MKRKVIILSTSPFPYGDNITDGPGYRAWNLFGGLSTKHEIIILSLYESFHLKIKNEYEVKENNFLIKCIRHKPKRISYLIEQEKPDILYLPWSSTPFLNRLKQRFPTIIDYVGAGLLEQYATKGYIPLQFLQTKLKSFWFGDLFLTAGQRERFYLLGLLAASKKLSHGRYDQADELIHVIPMTPPIEPPLLNKDVIQKKAGELVLLVAGAFLPWYDYTTFFEALRILSRKKKQCLQVVFMGGNPRNPRFEHNVKDLGRMSELKEEIVYTGTVPFKQRINYYLLADVAVNIPSITIEDELSVRTRVVDYIWAGLPILTPAKDEYSAAVVEEGGGFTYKAGNSASLAQAIEEIVANPEKLKQSKRKLCSLLKGRFNLQNYISPLEKFIDNPYIDPARIAPTGVGSDLFLLLRDILSFLRR